jgi:CheY-like chemotaxis protein
MKNEMNTLQKDRPVLIAEDEPNDAFLLETALKRIPIPTKFHMVQDGQEVIDYLSGQGRFSNRSEFLFPSILFLDLKMPRMNGLEVLKWIKSHPETKVIPTIIFSSSALERDVWESYELGANSYLVKPTSFEELARRMHIALEFWSICALPELPHRMMASVDHREAA